jgi:hypothetical protein
MNGRLKTTPLFSFITEAVWWLLLSRFIGRGWAPAGFGCWAAALFLFFSFPFLFSVLLFYIF